MAYVYIHKTKDTDTIFYVGIGTRPNYLRAKTICKRNVFWKNIQCKHGFVWEIVFDNISLEEAQAKEIDLIKHYGRRDLGNGSLVNLTDGGEGITNYIPTKEYRERLSIANKGRIITWGDKISKARKGKPLSPEHLAKIKLIPTYRKKYEMTDAHKAKVKENIKKFDKNLNVINFGKKIQQFDKLGNFIAEYPSIKNAAKTVGIPKANINQVLCGKAKTGSGFIWKLKEITA